MHPHAARPPSPPTREDGMRRIATLYHVGNGQRGLSETMTAAPTIVRPTARPAFQQPCNAYDAPRARIRRDRWHPRTRRGCDDSRSVTSGGEPAGKDDWLPWSPLATARNRAHRSHPKGALTWDIEPIVGLCRSSRTHEAAEWITAHRDRRSTVTCSTGAVARANPPQ